MVEGQRRKGSKKERAELQKLQVANAEKRQWKNRMRLGAALIGIPSAICALGYVILNRTGESGIWRFINEATINQDSANRITMPNNFSYDSEDTGAHIIFTVEPSHQERLPEFQYNPVAFDQIVGAVSDQMTQAGVGQAANLLNNVEFNFTDLSGLETSNTSPNIAPANGEDIWDGTIEFDVNAFGGEFAALITLYVGQDGAEPGSAQAASNDAFEAQFDQYSINRDVIRNYGVGAVIAGWTNAKLAESIYGLANQRAIVDNSGEISSDVLNYHVSEDPYATELAVTIFQQTLTGKIPPVFVMADGGVIDAQRVWDLAVEQDMSIVVDEEASDRIHRIIDILERDDINK